MELPQVLSALGGDEGEGGGEGRSQMENELPDFSG